MLSWFGRALCVSVVGCSSSPPLPASVQTLAAATSVSVDASSADYTKLWPLLDGWKPEVIVFPLGFAPSIDLIGAEILRFAPNFYDRAAQGYFTYAFVWHVEVPHYPVTAVWLRGQLAAYFDGLCVAVSDPPGTGCATQPTLVTIAAPTTTPFAALAGVPAHSIAIATFDGFNANQPVGLAGTVTVARCGTTMLVAVTLAPPAGLAATELVAQAHTFALAAATGPCVEALQ